LHREEEADLSSILGSGVLASKYLITHNNASQKFLICYTYLSNHRISDFLNGKGKKGAAQKMLESNTILLCSFFKNPFLSL
jgi:hypothetical protein